MGESKRLIKGLVFFVAVLFACAGFMASYLISKKPLELDSNLVLDFQGFVGIKQPLQVKLNGRYILLPIAIDGRNTMAVVSEIPLNFQEAGDFCKKINMTLPTKPFQVQSLLGVEKGKLIFLRETTSILLLYLKNLGCSLVFLTYEKLRVNSRFLTSFFRFFLN